MSRLKQPASAQPVAAASFFGRILTARHFVTSRRKLVWYVGTLIPCVSAVLWWQAQRLQPGLQPGSESLQLSAMPQGERFGSPTEKLRGSNPGTSRVLSVNARPIAQTGPSFLKQQYTGIITARRTTQLAAKSLGRVEQLTVELGDRVAVGQMLVRLDSRQLMAQRDVLHANLMAAQELLKELENGPRRQELEQSQARLDELRSLMELQQAQLTRTEQLDGSSVISQQELDESRFRTDAVKAQLQSAMQADSLLQEGTRSERIAAQQAAVTSLKAQLKEVDIQLEEKQIVAPYAGHIQSRLVDEGTIVAAGQPLLEIVETGALEIHVGLPDEMADRMTHATADHSLVVCLGERRLTTSLARISPSINSATRTREVVLAVELGDSGEYSQPAIGSAVNVEAQVSIDAQGLWVPTSALTAGTRGLWAVFVAMPISESGREESSIASHTIVQRQVELLRSQGQWSEIRGPLDAHELLVIDGTHRVVAGQEVRVAETVSEQTNL